MSIVASNWARKVLIGTNAHPNERLILRILAHRHNATTGACFPSVRTMAAEAGLCERRVQENIKKLVARGCVQIRRRFESGLQLSNQYNLVGVTKKAGLAGVTGGTPDKEVPSVQGGSPDQKVIPSQGEYDGPAGCLNG